MIARLRRASAMTGLGMESYSGKTGGGGESSSRKLGGSGESPSGGSNKLSRRAAESIPAAAEMAMSHQASGARPVKKYSFDEYRVRAKTLWEKCMKRCQMGGAGAAPMGSQGSGKLSSQGSGLSGLSSANGASGSHGSSHSGALV